MIERGQNYQEVGPPRVGSRRLVWLVEDVFIGTDGQQYARLVCHADPSLRKTLALVALADRKRYARAVAPS